MSLLSVYQKSFVVGIIHNAETLYLEKEKTHF